MPVQTQDQAPNTAGDAHSEETVLAGVRPELLVAGDWRSGSTGQEIEVEDPSTGRALLSIADATVDDAVTALDAAVAAQAEWAAVPPRTRGEILRSAFELIVERTEQLALLMTLEMGKPLAQSRGEVAYGAEFFRWFSEESVRVAGRYATAPDGSSRLLTLRQPVGPTLMITPWNFPLAMGTRKIGPAIAAGCTMIVKPARQTPLTMLALADLLEEVGLPPGVLNVIPTTRTGDVVSRLMGDPRLRKVTFTGSTPVGQTLMRQAAEQVLRVSMELGGNAPFLVFEDADLEAAVEGAMLAKMRNMGEACTAANRFYVHEKVADEFTERFAARMSAEVLGRGTEPGVTVGPLIDANAVSGVSDLVSDAVSRGARAVAGGNPIPGEGYFFSPTVLADVPADAPVMRQEIFGPVAPVSTFRTEAEAVAKANDTSYGLASYFFTRDLDRSLRIAEALEFGMVGVNQGIVSNPAAPFGGVKHSGVGREGGLEGIEEYLSVKYVGIRT